MFSIDGQTFFLDLVLKDRDISSNCSDSQHPQVEPKYTKIKTFVIFLLLLNDDFSMTYHCGGSTDFQ